LSGHEEPGEVVGAGHLSAIRCHEFFDLFQRTSRIAGEFLPSPRDPGTTFTAITQIGTKSQCWYISGDIARISQWAGSILAKFSQ
jgi:hypothetical protein